MRPERCSGTRDLETRGSVIGNFHREVRDEIMDFESYFQRDGLALGEMVRRGEVSALELLETAIARAEAVNPKINAIVCRFYERAREMARSFKPGNQPFAGVPLLLKDILGNCEGAPTRSASSFLPDTRATSDSYLVARFRQA